VAFHRPFHRSSVASIGHVIAPSNAYAIGFHRPFHRGFSIPHTPTAIDAPAAALVALRRTDRKREVREDVGKDLVIGNTQVTPRSIIF
jgi:hypothetical protein